MPRYARRTREVDEAILGTYLSGANSRWIRKALKPLLGEEHLSKSAVSRVVSRLKERFEEWQNRALSEEVYAIVYLDGFHLKVRMAKRVNQRTRTGRARGRARRAQTSVVIASGGERSLDALGLRAGGTPGSRTPGSQRRVRHHQTAAEPSVRSTGVAWKQLQEQRFDIHSRLGGHLHGDDPPAQDDCKAHGPWPGRKHRH